MIMPIAMSATFAFFPAGLGLYWGTNTILSIAQQWNINRLIEAPMAAKRTSPAHLRPRLVPRTPAPLPLRVSPAVALGPAHMTRTDTIVAAATPPGRGGVGIVRLSGPKVPEVAAVMLGELPQARHVTFARFLDAQHEPIDAGLALFFPAPHSYTGEHVLELHGHGGPVVMDALVERAVELGARRALAGEFTQRAFLNDKLDLAQAE